MVSSEPPLTHSGNSTHLLDSAVTMPQGTAINAEVATGARPLGAGPGQVISLESLSLVYEHDLDDINNM